MLAALRPPALRVWAAALVLVPLLPGASEASTWDTLAGDACVVRSHGSPLAEDVLAHCEAAVPVVQQHWPGFAARVTVVIAAGTAELSSLLPGTGDLTDVAALATDQVLVNPDAYATLSPVGRQVVLVHEVTHVATHGVPSVPTWLTEGFAEAVAHADGALPVDVAAQELAAELRAGRVPTALPADEGFATASHYEQAWRAVELLARTHGWEALRRFYRAGGDFRLLGTTEEAFVSSWRVDLVRTFS